MPTTRTPDMKHRCFETKEDDPTWSTQSHACAAANIADSHPDNEDHLLPMTAQNYNSLRKDQLVGLLVQKDKATLKHADQAVTRHQQMESTLARDLRENLVYYSGDRAPSAIRTFLRQFRDYFDEAPHMTQRERVRLAISRLRGTAAEWADRYELREVTTWTEFKQSFEEYFYIPGALTAAKAKLKACTQRGRPVAKSFEEFERLCIDANILDDDTKRDKFLDGLDPVMQAKLQLNEDDLQTFQRLTRAAHNLDTIRSQYPEEFNWRTTEPTRIFQQQQQQQPIRYSQDRWQQQPNRREDRRAAYYNNSRYNNNSNRYPVRYRYGNPQQPSQSIARPASSMQLAATRPTSLITQQQGEYLFDSLAAQQYSDLFEQAVAIIDTGSCDICSMQWIREQQIPCNIIPLQTAMTIRTASGNMIAQHRAVFNLRISQTLTLPISCLVTDYPASLPILIGMNYLEKHSAILDCRHNM